MKREQHGDILVTPQVLFAMEDLLKQSEAGTITDEEYDAQCRKLIPELPQDGSEVIVYCPKGMIQHCW